MNRVKIRSAIQNDVESIVDVHMVSFPGFFLSFLGPRFLQAFYSNIIGMQESVSLVALNENLVVEGFVVGTLSPEGMYKRLLKNSWLEFALASVMPAIRQPLSIPRLLRALRAPNNERIKSSDCLLMSIGVSPHAEGSGAGGQLVAKFLELAGEHGARIVCLTTDSENNERVNQFYLKAGFELHHSFSTPEGRKMNEYYYYIKSL